MEVLWCSSPRHRNLIPTQPLSIGNTSVLPVSAVRDGEGPRDPRHHEEPCHRDRSFMLRCITIDSQFSSTSSSTRLADRDSCPCGRQGGLLHFCTRQHHWSPNGQVTVRSKCRCSVGLVSPEIRAHNSAVSRATLAASSRAYPVLVVRPCPPLSPRLSSIIPCREPPPDHRNECPSLPVVRRQLAVDYTIHTAFDPWRSGIPCGSVQGLEQSAQFNEEHRVFAKFSPETQNIALLVVV